MPRQRLSAPAATAPEGPAAAAGADVADDGAVHRALGSSRRAAILALLREHPGGLDVGRIAAATGLHANTVRHHLAALNRTGLVHRRRDPAATGGRPRMLFAGAPGAGLPAAAGDGYSLLAGIMVDELAAQGAATAARRATAAGRRWVRQRVEASAHPPAKSPARRKPSMGNLSQHVADEVTALFAAVGFGPEQVRRERDWEIRLHRCPFIELAKSSPEVVCGVHLGLLQGALDQLGVPAGAARLAPFVTPTLCVAALAAGMS